MTMFAMPAIESDFPSAPMVPGQTGRVIGFLQNEAAAARTYQAVIERLDDADGVCCRGLLRQFQEEHDLAADVFRQGSRADGDVADLAGDAGIWEPALHQTGRVFQQSLGGQSTLQCLRDAELHMLEEYVDSLQHLPDSMARFIREQLLPAQRRHIHMLRELLGEQFES